MNKNNPKPPPNPDPPPDNRTPAERFEAAMKTILLIPKERIKDLEKTKDKPYKRKA